MAVPGVLTRVPFVDLEPVNAPVRAEILDEVAELARAGSFVNGPAVAEFERAFAGFCGSARCVGVSSGIDALRLALEAAGLESGDDVAVPAQTFAATFAAVTQAGGTPVPVDVTESDYCLDPRGVPESARFLVPVHLYGQMADVSTLRELAGSRGALIVEDACQAPGAARDGLRAGTVGVAGAFSFYPSKNLGAWGDAGAVVTDDEGVAERVRRLREHGQTSKYRHETPGYTARLDTVQAIVLQHRLEGLVDQNRRRSAAASYYSETLSGLGDLHLPPVPDGSDPVWHLYVVRTRQRDGLRELLAERGIHTGLHYPEPPHLSPAFAPLGYARGDFPVAEALAAEGLSLPLFAGISEEQLEAVCSGVGDYFG
jgi:dTDP-4-amino-4,6-dideoxygalactose transaminase